MKFFLSLCKRFDNSVGEKIGVIDFFGRIVSMLGHRKLMKVMTAHIVKERPGMAVCGADHDVGNGNPRLATGFIACLSGHVQRNADEVAKYESNLFPSLPEDDGFGFEWIMRARGEPFVKIAGHAMASRRRDVDFRSADLQRGRRGTDVWSVLARGEKQKRQH